MEQTSYVIIGNGIAGATAAEVLRAEDSAAEVTVIADDAFPVYYRPALKDYLGGKLREEKLWTRPISFYQDRQIRFITDRVMAIQPVQHSLQLRSGQRVGYSSLLLANGARATSLSCPGLNLAGVTTLRTVADYQQVLRRLNAVRRVVVVGSGTLALETIETLRHRSIQVTHLLRRRTLWSEVLDATASDLVLQQEQRDGTDVLMEQEIAEIIGKDGQVTGVITTAGRSISCELVILAIGIDPVIDFVKEAGIACGRGVKVDGGMRTNLPDIYAAGDLIETTDPITARARVIGQWYPAIQQARAAAYSMLDLLDTRHHFRFGNFYNATFLYGLDFASVGISSIPKNGKGYQELLADPLPRTYQKAILKDGVAVGMLVLGDRRRALPFKRAVDHAINLSSIADRLYSPDFNLSTWLDKQGVPPPVLGINRAGAVAVNKAAYAAPGDRSVILRSSVLTEAFLLAVSPPEDKAEIKEIYLSQTKVSTIGRQEGVVLVIQHPSVSRRHAEISYANGQYVLRDLGSSNGTCVNEKQIKPGIPLILHAEDQVSFGDVRFSFHVRQVSSDRSVLVHRQKDGNNQVVPFSPTPSFHSEEEKLQTMQVEVKALAGVASPVNAGLFVLNSDGSLTIPGINKALPAATVSTLKRQPALIALAGNMPEVFPLHRGKSFSLGRDKNCEIVLADPSISRRHAEIFPGPDGLYIRDLGSSNGIVINQVKITGPYHLSHTDKLKVGNIRFLFIDLTLHDASLQQSSPALIQNQGKARAQRRFCSGCGTEVNGEMPPRFCPQCGLPLYKEN